MNKLDPKLIAQIVDVVNTTVTVRLGEVLSRLDTLELDQEVLWDDMQKRSKEAEMFPQELQTQGEKASEAPSRHIRAYGFGA